MVNHIMVITIADHTQVEIDIVFLKKVERMHSLTRRMDASQLQSWKSGQSKR